MTNAGNTKTLTKNYLFINVYIYFFTFKAFLSKLPNSYDFFLICSKTMDNLIKIFLNQRKNKIVVQKLYLMLYIWIILNFCTHCESLNLMIFCTGRRSIYVYSCRWSFIGAYRAGPELTAKQSPLIMQSFFQTPSVGNPNGRGMGFGNVQEWT